MFMKKTRNAFLIIVVGIMSLCHSFVIVAQVDSTRAFHCVVEQDISLAFNDAKKVYKSIGSITWNDIAVGSAITGTAIALMSIDDEMRNIAQRNYSALNSPAMTTVNEYGNVYYPVAAGAITYTAGLVFDSPELRETSRLAMEALLLSGIITTTVKTFVGRARPYTEKGPNSFSGFTFQDGNLSFPSGHATAAFAISTILSKHIDRWWADILLYGLATGTAYARMHNDKHWFSDVFMGASIGYASASLIHSIQQESGLDDKSGQSKKIGYYITPSGAGLIVHL